MTSITARGDLLDMDADAYPDWYQQVPDERPQRYGKFETANGSRPRDTAGLRSAQDTSAQDFADAVYLTTEQAATYLNVKVRFIRRLVEDGRVTVTKVGRFNRFTRADLDATCVRRTGSVTPSRHLGVIDPADPIAAVDGRVAEVGQ